MDYRCFIKRSLGKRRNIIILGRALVTLLAFSINCAIVPDEVAQQNYEKIYSFLPELSKLFLAIDTNVFQSIILILLLIKFYQNTSVIKIDGRKKGICVILAIIMSVSLLLGNAFEKYKSIEILLLGMIQKLKTCIILTGYSVFLFNLLSWLMYGYDKYFSKCNEGKSTYFNRKNTYFRIMGLLLLAWLPTLFAYYPAMFMGDTEDIVYMAFNYPTVLNQTVKMIKEGVYLTNHHPVIYTTIIGTIMKVVIKFGGTDNMAIFICAILQCIVNAAVLSYSCIYCARNIKKPKIAICAVLFWMLCPWITKYAIMISKDTIFADFVLLFSINLHKLLKDLDEKKLPLNIIMPAILVILFRKNGFYVVLLTLVGVLVLYRKYWRKWIFCIAMIMVFNMGYSHIILPAFGIADGSVREALSIPFQQTARYVLMYEDEVTVEERKAIDAVLQYDVLGVGYNPNLSDPVKGTYKVEAGSEDLMNYFKAWFFMFWKHPGTYIAATLNNYYGYFYPIVNDVQKLYNTSVGSMCNTNRDGYFEFGNMYDEIHIWSREFFSFYDMLWMKVPIINIFMTSAFYVWIVILGCFFKVVRKDKIGFIFILSYFILILTALAGPCNAINYERYIYPCILALPIMIAVVLQEGND